MNVETRVVSKSSCLNSNLACGYYFMSAFRAPLAVYKNSIIINRKNILKATKKPNNAFLRKLKVKILLFITKISEMFHSSRVKKTLVAVGRPYQLKCND